MASFRVLFEGLAVVAVLFRNVQIGEHGATRPVHLVPSSPWVFNLLLFLSPFLGSSKGPSLTKILLSPSGTTVSPGVFNPTVDRSVIMHGLCRESPSQLCCGFRIQLRVRGWPLFGRITWCSRFTCLKGFYVFFCIQLFVLLHT